MKSKNLEARLEKLESQGDGSRPEFIVQIGNEVDGRTLTAEELAELERQEKAGEVQVIRITYVEPRQGETPKEQP